MSWLELAFTVPDDENLTEIFTARLDDLAFDSFVQEDLVLKAYVSPELFKPDHLAAILSEETFGAFRLLTQSTLEDKNWNALWEASYDAVIINQLCRIRAPFHAADPNFKYDLIIEPKMSFGTAHHDTTAQVLKLMLDLKFAGKQVLDMGSGTAVLAILARKLGAQSVVAIDNDIWAFNNACDNVVLNQVPEISIELGDASAIGGRMFDVILANINRNILLADMHIYAAALHPNGMLVLSGFYTEDLEIIQNKAQSLDLQYEFHTYANNWVAAVFRLKQ